MSEFTQYQRDRTYHAEVQDLMIALVGALEADPTLVEFTARGPKFEVSIRRAVDSGSSQ